MTPAVFHRLARRELADAVEYYKQVGHGPAFVAQIRRTIVRIRRFPESAPRVRGAVRRVVVAKYPYALLYSVDTSMVRILAVAHQRRDPEYWIERT